MGGPRTAREVRLWHWRKVMTHRGNAKMFQAQMEAWEIEHAPLKARHSRSKMNQQNGIADWHLNAVQALNEFVSGTAEQDEIESKLYNHIPRRGT